MAKTNSSFKFPKYLKRILSSRYSKPGLVKYFVDAESTAQNLKNRKFVDPASSTQRSNKQETTQETTQES